MDYREQNIFKNICKMNQHQLKEWLVTQLIKLGYNPIVEDGYIYARGTAPILLTAHMDTVHKSQISQLQTTVSKGKTIMTSPQGIGGDDRCGIYIILKLAEKHAMSILFCEDEEIGGVGSEKFCKSKYISELKNNKYLIELDRANANDAVFYDCDNNDFTKFILENTSYKEAQGTFSDISNLCPECGVAGVNLSCGYYNAHTTKEYVIWEDMIHTINIVDKLLTTQSDSFEYIEKYNEWYSFANYGYDFGHLYTSKNKKVNTDDIDYDCITAFITYEGEDGCEYVESYGRSKAEALCKFFMDNPTISWSMVLDYEFDYLG